MGSGQLVVLATFVWESMCTCFFPSGEMFESVDLNGASSFDAWISTGTASIFAIRFNGREKYREETFTHDSLGGSDGYSKEGFL